MDELINLNESLLTCFYVVGGETTGVSSNFDIPNGTIQASLNFSVFLGFINNLGIICDTTTSGTMVFVNWTIMTEIVFAFTTFIKSMLGFLKLKWPLCGGACEWFRLNLWDDRVDDLTCNKCEGGIEFNILRAGGKEVDDLFPVREGFTDLIKL